MSSKIKWSHIQWFDPGEFPKDPDKYAEPNLIYYLDEYRNRLGHKVRPSTNPDGFVRFDGSPTSQHFVSLGMHDEVIIKTKAVDVFPDCNIFRAWSVALDSKLWGGIGVYFDTKFRGKSHCMLHLDIRDNVDFPVLWFRANKKYHSVRDEGFWTLLGSHFGECRS